MLSMHILQPKQSNFKILGQFENLGFVIMSTRENIHLIARTPSDHNVSVLHVGISHSGRCSQFNEFL